MQLFTTLFSSLIVTAVLGAPAGPVTDVVQVMSFGSDEFPGTSVSMSPSAEVLAQLRAQAQGQAKCDQNIGVPGGLFICNGANFTGQCRWLAPPTDKPFPCYEFVADAAHRPNSFGPDAAGFCYFFASNNCTGENVKCCPNCWALRCPGLADARGLHPNDPYWYDSVQCWSG